ncbi:helicase-associated domain-containing protein [Streptomyces sp. ZYX-F-203]
MKSRSTLAKWLGGLDGSRLAEVIRAREDAAAPPEPRSLGELADRLRRPGSVALALPRLTMPCLQVAEALASLREPASPDALTELLGVTDEPTSVGLRTTLGALADLALIWPDDAGRLHMSEALRQAWGQPLGLDEPTEQLLTGLTSEELRAMLTRLGVKPPAHKATRLAALVAHHGDPERVASVVAEAPTATRKLLERLADEESSRSAFLSFGFPEPSDRAERWAVERGLLVRRQYDYGPARMPAEVARALRGPDWHAPFDPDPPTVASTPVTSTDVDSEASAAATAFASQAALVLSSCSTTPPTTLKSGGIGARELARLGKATQAEAAVVRLVLETAHRAGLLNRSDDHVAPTPAYDAWAEQEPAERFAVLLRSWRDLPLTPTQARDEDDKPVPALAGAPPCGGCAQARDGLLATAARLPADHGAKSLSDLGHAVGWHRPFAHMSASDGTPFATVAREAELLGVVARGALSGLGRALRAGTARDLEAECRRLLPSATSTARIGADLTAVVTGTPSSRLATLLDSVADRETSGTASVWRFSAAGIRRALDAGEDPADIAKDLAAVAAGPLPQPLSYLIADTARGHGRVRVAPAGCVLHGDDPALLAEIAAHRRFGKLGLRRLAPTVLVARASLDATLAALRAEGYAPVSETATGTVRIEKSRPRRAKAPVPAPRRTRGRPGGKGAAKAATPVDPERLAARLSRQSSADATAPDDEVPFTTATEKSVAHWAKRLAPSDVRQLAHAVDTGRPVTVEYVATSGNRTVRTLSDLELDPPYLDAWCGLRDAERVFTLSRIRGVMGIAPE